MRSAVDRYVDGLLRRRRPRPFAPSEDDLAVTRTAIALAAAGPDGLEPDRDFVEGLRRQLARQAGRGAAGTVEDPARAPAPAPARARPAVPARRRLLQATALTAGAAAVGAGAEHLITRPAPPGRPAGAQGELTPLANGTWQTVAADADLPEGGVLSFDAGSVVGFVRRASGRVQAVSGICTHQGCRLDLSAAPQQLVCPCHGATFSVAGQPLTYPHAPTFPMQPLPRLAVRVQGGAIQVFAVAASSTPAQATAPTEYQPDGSAD